MNPLSAALSQRARSVEEANTATPEDAHESVLQLGACANGAETSVVRQPESLDKGAQPKDDAEAYLERGSSRCTPGTVSVYFSQSLCCLLTLQ